MMKVRWFAIAGFLLLSLVASIDVAQAVESQQEAKTSTGDVKEMVSKVSTDVGDIGKTGTGSKGAPIVIMEEMHTSRIGQIEIAIALNRLHETYGLKHIALEGYLKEDLKIDVAWFEKAANRDSVMRARVAVRLLREGEISNAEFMKLAYDDIFLVPIETTKEYVGELDEATSYAPYACLIKIAQTSLRDSHVPTLEKLNAAFENTQDEKEKGKKLKELLDYILSADPWAQSKARAMEEKDPTKKAFSIEQDIRNMEEILSKVKEKGVELEPAEKEGLEKYLALLRNRGLASKTMCDLTGTICDQSGVAVVAMIIGAGHTEGVCQVFADGGRSFGVLSPNALKTGGSPSDLTSEMFERKEKSLSVYSEGFMADLTRELGSRKPKSVLNEPWFQGKAELYMFTDRIVEGICPPTVPPNGGNAPYGFPEDAFRGKCVYINPQKIEIVLDGSKRRVFFPVELNPGTSRSKTIYVKAGIDDTKVSTEERENVEAMLEKNLKELKKEGKPTTKLEDVLGRVKITIGTIAVLGSSAPKVKTISI